MMTMMKSTSKTKKKKAMMMTMMEKEYSHFRQMKGGQLPYVSVL